MRNVMTKGLAAVAAALALGAMTLPAQAETSVMKQCSAKYKAEKQAGKLKAGEKWTTYYASCAKSMKAKGETGKTKAGTKKREKKAEKRAASKAGSSAHKPLTAKQIAAHKRQKECGAMWRKDKAAGKIRSGDTWPKYWHRCNLKLRAKTR